MTLGIPPAQEEPGRPLAHDHVGCVCHALQEADQRCAERGVRFTPIRRKVLELIWESHKPTKAYDLLDRIKPLDGSAKPATVYRALDFLLEQGLIHRVESLNAFIGCGLPEHQHDLLLLICKHCQEVEERPAQDVMAAAASEAAAAGFTVQSKAIEIHGLCARCAEETSNG